MRFLNSFVVLLAAGAAQAVSSWGFDDATLSVTAKKGDGVVKQKFSEKSLPESPVALGSADTLKIILTAKENGKAAKPHQAFLLLQEPDSGLEAPFPLTLKENGKATVDIKHIDIPAPLLLATKPLHASLIIASFGSSQGYNSPVFDVVIKLDPSATPAYEKPLRYGKLEEIHHTFRADAKSPPMTISLVFVGLVVATVPTLFFYWGQLGGNVAHLQKAFSAAPVSHGVFFGSIVAMEAVFYLYYSTWNLFQILPVIGAVGVTTVLSGTKALGEVQSRRLAGER
ncbi:Oligosaccharyltransferase subunit Ribophorin II-domain-containing protein [Pseudomassariella vexata]|uniref:Oligosaccharyltransferase subunit Ribophorin II-domain-containing protein n=1 Tax=Pseudomassariella vexata TaxID=1141098 RepID=A0A1Y2D5T4_9PEZI|nr:Oligosaccharyltransferase subunit Ribophorin II-domain-containing protein [Pseudomassariella vexata]ORY54567.1 Oligosaccharyltransferase subunit Ribophorin II-domain-containing protein [Pseudomassariella vexata]